LEKSLEDFRQQHPQAFNGTDSESKAAQQAMSNAADSLQSNLPRQEKPHKKPARV
jgi:hypothetical protein